MDDDGTWRAPEEWPEDYPPLPGWVRDPAGGWRSPGSIPIAEFALDSDDHVTVAPKLADSNPAHSSAPEPEPEPTPTDNRTMLIAAGVAAAAVVLLVAALVVISQAGASDSDDDQATDSSVIFAVQTDRDVEDARAELARSAPSAARTALAELPAQDAVPSDAAPYDAGEWTVPDDGCLSHDEVVLIRRSTVTVGYADQIDCVPATGRWIDRYQDSRITRTIDAEVRSLVPTPEVHAAGGWRWSPATRLAYLTDTDHPATLQVVAAGSGHNPRQTSPSEWRPAAEATWCAYAVDWIGVKARWELSVTDDERLALGEMLDTCDAPSSHGADPETVPFGEPMAPEIEFTDS